jgi:prevent-host-death family protein
VLISASDFKARCLAILDEVRRTGEEVTITKRGVPIATLVAARPQGHRYPQDALVGSVEVVGDIVNPVLPPGAWEAEAIGPVKALSRREKRPRRPRRGRGRSRAV